MRARNREINIFNMSLLDILTGMLGAFLFLMLAMMPYYAKVSKNKDIDPAEVQQLREKVASQEKEIADLKKQIEDLKKQLADNSGDPQLTRQLQQQVDQLTKERNFWKNSQGTITISSFWDSEATDIDVLVLTPTGDIISPKAKDTALGKKCLFDGDDSHGPGYSTRHEGLLVFLTGPGDYLVFYRVPKNADPATYANLQASYMYFETQGMEANQGVSIHENGLNPSRSSGAAPGGLYAWTVLTYDPDKMTITAKDPDKVKLPRGIQIPGDTPLQPAPTPPNNPLFHPRSPFPPRPGAAPVAPSPATPPSGGGPPPAPGF